MVKHQSLVHAMVIPLLFVLTIVNAAAESSEAPSEDNGPVAAAINGGKLILDVRYRFELKSQAGFAEDAYANTVRTRFGFESGEVYNLKVLVELENVFNIGEDHFNSTTNGLTQFPVIADPDATEINRAHVTFTGIEKTPITVGRQRFNLNNHRFIGAVDFRQNQQTFDAARVSTKLIDNVSIDYVYISRVHRIFGDDNPLGEFDSDSHVIAASYDTGLFGTIKGYGVLLDLGEASGLSSATWGVRYENAISIDEETGVDVSFVGEYASQKDYAANPNNYREDYLHGEATLKIAPFSATIGYESLGGNGVNSFSTPLATLHKFQGFADVFLATPAAGIEDLYAGVAYQWTATPLVDNVRVFARFHEFESDRGNVDFGHEIDAGLVAKFEKHWSLELKGAIYEGAVGFADRSLLWASLRFQY